MINLIDQLEVPKELLVRTKESWGKRMLQLNQTIAQPNILLRNEYDGICYVIF